MGTPVWIGYAVSVTIPLDISATYGDKRGSMPRRSHQCSVDTVSYLWEDRPYEAQFESANAEVRFRSVQGCNIAGIQKTDGF